MTAVAGSVFTAAQFNQSVRDNLNETGPAKISAAGQILVGAGSNSLAARTIAQNNVGGSAQTTTSNTYTDLATVGPAVAAVTGTQALIAIYGAIACSSAGNAALMAWTVSGASSIATNDAQALSSNSQTAGALFLVPGLTAGTNTFTAKYRTGAGTGTFSQRSLLVIPL